MPILDILRTVEGEPNDNPLKFTNIDTEGFQFGIENPLAGYSQTE